MDSESVKTGKTVLVYISGSAPPDSGQTRAMRHIEHAADLVLELVGRKVAAIIAAAGKAIVRQNRPHPIQQTGAAGTLAAVMNENLSASLPLDQRAKLL